MEMISSFRRLSCCLGQHGVKRGVYLRFPEGDGEQLHDLIVSEQLRPVEKVLQHAPRVQRRFVRWRRVRSLAWRSMALS